MRRDTYNVLRTYPKQSLNSFLNIFPTFYKTQRAFVCLSVSALPLIRFTSGFSKHFVTSTLTQLVDAVKEGLSSHIRYGRRFEILGYVMNNA